MDAENIARNNNSRSMKVWTAHSREQIKSKTSQWGQTNHQSKFKVVKRLLLTRIQNWPNNMFRRRRNKSSRRPKWLCRMFTKINWQTSLTFPKRPALKSKLRKRRTVVKLTTRQKIAKMRRYSKWMSIWTKNWTRIDLIPIKVTKKAVVCLLASKILNLRTGRPKITNLIKTSLILLKMALNLGQWQNRNRKKPSEQNQPKLLQEYQNKIAAIKSSRNIRRLYLIAKLVNKKVRNQKRIQKMALKTC